MGSSRFDSLNILNAGEAHTLKAAYQADKSRNKVFLGVGAYRDYKGLPWILPAIKKAKQRLAQDPTDNHEYLPISGDPLFIQYAQRLIFGEPERYDTDQINSPRIVSLQTISGTGANHIGARFLVESLQPRAVWISDPSWINHSVIWQMLQPLKAGEDIGLRIRYYPYYSQASQSPNLEEMVRVLEAEASANDVIVLQPSAHNPTGIDFTHNQWKVVADLCHRKRIFPFFDSAYQGLATGNLDNDVWAIRYFVSCKIELCVAQSFSKNMGLYSERVGAYHLVLFSKHAAAQSLQKLIQIQRGEISSPPAFGAKVASAVLSDPVLYEEWLCNIQEMVSRLRAMRTALADELYRLGTPGFWDQLLKGVGMFSCTGLDPGKISQLKAHCHIFMLESGRISLAGLTEENVIYVARAIDAVVRDKTCGNHVDAT